VSNLSEVRDYIMRLEQAVVAYAITCEMYECALTSMSKDYEALAAAHDIIPDPGMNDALQRLRMSAGAVAEKFPVEELGVCHDAGGAV